MGAAMPQAAYFGPSLPSASSGGKLVMMKTGRTRTPIFCVRSVSCSPPDEADATGVPLRLSSLSGEARQWPAAWRRGCHDLLPRWLTAGSALPMLAAR